jgi:ribonuclease R
MRSAARLTYEQVQACFDVGDEPEGWRRAMSAALRRLPGPAGARERRGTLDLDLPERRVMLDARAGSRRWCRARASIRTG